MTGDRHAPFCGSPGARFPRATRHLEEGGEGFDFLGFHHRLVGKLDATADRRAGVLRVDAVHQDVPFDRAMTAAVDGEIKDLAHWLELDLTLPG